MKRYTTPEAEAEAQKIREFLRLQNTKEYAKRTGISIHTIHTLKHRAGIAPSLAVYLRVKQDMNNENA